jgi:PAS domain S-box-containing protein
VPKQINHLLEENKKLNQEKLELSLKLKEANEIIESIRNGNIDAIMIATNRDQKMLVSDRADQTYRRFIENMSEGVVTLYGDGNILYSNSSFANIVNVSLENVIGANLRNFIPIEYVGIFEKLFNNGPGDNGKMELSFLNQDGSRSYYMISFNALHLEDFLAINLVWTDVTDQKKAGERLIAINDELKQSIEERILSESQVVMLNRVLKGNIKVLEEANTELTSFAHIASHDLQEPLRKIMTYSSMLEKEYQKLVDQRGQNYIEKIVNSSARMRNLIKDILEYAELSNNGIDIKPTDLQTIVNDVLSDLEIVIQETNAQITVIEQLPVIEANASQMRQLFQNLISNSLKFISPDNDPRITISYETAKGRQIGLTDEDWVDEQFYRFYLKDNGIGFNPKHGHKIFTIFQRLNSHAAYQGTGIGLAICKKIVKRHNGFISAESNLSQGALFTITLPARQAVYERNNMIATPATASSLPE